MSWESWAAGYAPPRDFLEALLIYDSWLRATGRRMREEKGNGR